MSDIKLTRDERPVDGNVFVATPYGTKLLGDIEFDFDEFYLQELRPVIEESGMTSVRADSIYGPQTVMGPIWRGIQQAEVMLVDFTGRSPNVAMEFMAGTMIGKKMIYMTQDPDDVPTDVRGRLRYVLYSAHFADINRMRKELRQQIAAIRDESNVEMALVPMAAGGTDPVPAKVITVTREFVVIEALDGRRGVLGNADVEHQRIITDMARRFGVGDQLTGAFDVDTSGGTKYTLLAGVPSPWPRIKDEFPPGRTFTGIVQRTSDALGAFVPLAYGIDGLIHISTMANRTLYPGDQVEVEVHRVDSDKRRVSLHLLRTMGHAGADVPAQRESDESTFAKGQRHEGEVVKIAPEGAGGYLLLRLANRDRPVMLHCTAMTSELRDDLNSGAVEIGDVIDVEIMSVDRLRDRITVREVAEEELATSDQSEPVAVG